MNQAYSTTNSIDGLAAWIPTNAFISQDVNYLLSEFSALIFYFYSTVDNPHVKLWINYHTYGGNAGDEEYFEFWGPNTGTWYSGYLGYSTLLNRGWAQNDEIQKISLM
ncbi:MAG: hypothetical protein ACW99Q_08605, partial [Candidatus Kariarchaeaceae archaeon]